jgi:hypothetical protein
VLSRTLASWLLLATLILSVSASPQARTIQAVSAAHSDVAHAIASAQDGDTVVIPAGTATWNTQIRVTKNITLAGAGQDATHINDNVPKNGGDISIPMIFSVSGNLRVTGFTIESIARDPVQHNKGIVQISGTSHTVRIDHITFLHPACVGLSFYGDIWGVVDHCTFDSSDEQHQGVSVNHNNWNGDANGHGDRSFQEPMYLGTEKAVYIEDNTFTGQNTAGVLDGTMGARIVFRRNTVTNAFLGMHGTEGQRYRGLRSFEIYQNTFSYPGIRIFCCLYIRSGTGVIWGNTVKAGPGDKGATNFVLAACYRKQEHWGQPWGDCTGSNPWDGNQQPDGYPCMDQVGRGMCLDGLTADYTNPVNTTTNTKSWVRNQPEPVHVWSNNWTQPTSPGSYIQSQTSVIQVGRDILNNGNTPMPGYTPYTYPHPLTKGLPPPEQTPRNATANAQHDAHKKRRPWGGKKPERKQAKKAKESPTNEMPEGQENVDN